MSSLNTEDIISSDLYNICLLYTSYKALRYRPCQRYWVVNILTGERVGNSYNAHKMGEIIHDRAYAAHLPAHWASIKLLEGDPLVEKALELDGETKKKLQEIIAEYERSSDLGDRETLVADSRYNYIEQVVAKSVKKAGKKEENTAHFEKSFQKN